MHNGQFGHNDRTVGSSKLYQHLLSRFVTDSIIDVTYWAGFDIMSAVAQAPSSSGPGRRAFIPKIAGSNPAGVTNSANSDLFGFEELILVSEMRSLS